MEERRPLQIDFWDVGQADCSVITLPDGKLILIDVGRRGSPLVNWLQDRPATQVHALVLTHNDTDHAGALPGVLEVLGAHVERLLMLKDRPEWEPEFQRLFRRAVAWEQDGRRIERLEIGAEIWRDTTLGVELVTIHPTFSANVAAANPNTASGIVCLKLRGGTEIIWPGDSALATVASTCRGANPLVMVGPHHGAPGGFRLAATVDHIRDVAPRRAFISVGTKNSYHHPRAKYIRRLGREGCHVVCSQLTHRCDPESMRRDRPVFPSGPLLGLRPSPGVTCRGTWRLRLEAGALVPDRWDREHMERISKLRRPQCLYGRGWRHGQPLPAPVLTNPDGADLASG